MEFILALPTELQAYLAVLVLAGVFWFFGEGVKLVHIIFRGGSVPFLGKVLWVVYLSAIFYFYTLAA